MKITVAAAISAATFLANSVYAGEEQKVLQNEHPSASPDGSSAKLSQPLPAFVPTKIKGLFLEQFTDGWDQRWKASHAKKDVKDSEKGEDEWAYVGEWAVEEPVVLKGIEGDKGLVIKNAAAHHAISAKFPTKIDNTGKTLVIQYEVKLQNGLECGGAYLKLLRDTESLHQDEFSNATPYVIMFGPDKCGYNNKVHFIFNHKNPKTGQYEEKHLTSPPSANIVKTTELYTLLVHPNNTFVIQRNGDSLKEGSLLEDFTPSVNPPEEIDDLEDKKPEDWVDEARIPDSEAKKPDDWDEDQPFEIVDENAAMPDDWLVDEPLNVPDPEAEKPEEWDDEEDGEWIPPTIPNPKCTEASGCGPWTRPKKRNPDYKGKWTAPYIENPNYKGIWAPRKIPNPDYFEDKNPANLEPMGAIGFEIWTMQNNILFDNIYIGHSTEDAKKFAEETFFKKLPFEKSAEAAEKPEDEDDFDSITSVKFLENPVLYIQGKFNLFLRTAQKDPLQAIRTVPEVAGGIVALLLSLFAIIIGLFSSSSVSEASVKKAVASTKEKAEEVKDKVSEAVTTGADTVKDAVSKRANRT